MKNKLFFVVQVDEKYIFVLGDFIVPTLKYIYLFLDAL